MADRDVISQENGQDNLSKGLASDESSFKEYGADTLDVFRDRKKASDEAPSGSSEGVTLPEADQGKNGGSDGVNAEERTPHDRLEEEMAYGGGDQELPGYAEPAPKKRRRRRKKHPFLNLLIFAMLLTGAYFTLKSQLFTVTKIEVEGNRFYTKAQVIELSGLRTGYNLFEVQTRPARDAILSDPYIKYCKIDRVPRNTIRITVEERTEYAAVPYGDEYVLLDEDGLVLRISDSEPALPLLMGMSIIEMTPGSPLQIEQSYLLPGTLDLISVMDENDLYFKKIYFSTVIIRAYIYDNYYFEGTPSNIIANMQGIRQLLEEHYKQGITRGVIKVGNNNYLAFSPQIN